VTLVLQYLRRPHFALLRLGPSLAHHPVVPLLQLSFFGACILSNVAASSIAARCTMLSLSVVNQLIHLMQSENSETARHAVVALTALAALPCHRCAGWHTHPEFKARLRSALASPEASNPMTPFGGCTSACSCFCTLFLF
jgi:hypothetical protein